MTGTVQAKSPLSILPYRLLYKATNVDTMLYIPLILIDTDNEFSYCLYTWLLLLIIITTVLLKCVKAEISALLTEHSPVQKGSTQASRINSKGRKGTVMDFHVKLHNNISTLCYSYKKNQQFPSDLN